MSHASGAVRFKDGSIWFYEYNGTSDIVLPALYPTNKEMKANWRNGKWTQCKCGKEEMVEIYSGYGGNWYFTGKACRTCRAVWTTPEEEAMETETNGGDLWAMDIWEDPIDIEHEVIKPLALPLKAESLEKDLRVITYNAEQLIAMGKMFGVKPTLSLLTHTANFKNWIKSIDNVDKHKRA